jgi:hypothetical protein
VINNHEQKHQRLDKYLVVAGPWAERPNNPAQAALYKDTDRGGMEFSYNATAGQWLSTQLFPANFDCDQAKPIVTGAVAGTAYATSRVTIPEQPLLAGVGGILLVTTVLTLLETSANAHTATNYFDWTIQYTTAAGGVSAALTLGGTANTQGQGAVTYKGYSLLGAAGVTILDPGITQLVWTMTLRGAAPTAHTIYPVLAASYRLIGA